MISFITGNENKFKEISAILPSIEMLNIDLVEVQSLDPKEIILNKLEEARREHDGAFIVEDTSLYIDKLNGLPGPLIKWFMKAIGSEGLAELTELSGGSEAEASVMIGYSAAEGDVQFFEGRIKGTIVAPRGENGFGWDSIFQPENSDKTFAEMTNQEKNAMSMRGMAAKELKVYLNSFVQ